MFWLLMISLAGLASFFVTRPLLGQKYSALTVTTFLLAGSAMIYSYIGHPQFISAKLTSSSADNSPKMDDLLLQLKTRLTEKPEEAETWRMLGWAQFNAGRYQESVDAYSKATKIDPNNNDYKSALAEAIVQREKGVVTPEALKIFSSVLEKNPIEARSRFYQALEREQAGDQKTALNLWLAMLKDAKPSDQWRDEVARHADSLAKAMGRQNLAEEILKQKPDDQLEMIKSMVAGLAAKMELDPQNGEGWIKLMRAYVVLKETEKAKTTLTQALKNYKGDKASLLNAAKELGIAQ